MVESDTPGTLTMQGKDSAVRQLLTLEPRLQEFVDIDVEYIDNIDSANMSPAHWERMIDTIGANYDRYDGFVITHGTNTMAYTASALSYALGNLGKPVVLTGSQIPASRVETDARRNFVNAVRVATMDLAGVVIVFDEEIIMGSRASKVSESKLDAFETVNWDLLGEIRIDIRLADWRKRRHQQPLNVIKQFESNIAVLTLFPGFSPTNLERILDSGVKGLVLGCYGPGDISYDYLPVLEKAQQKKIPVVIDTQCLEGATLMHLNDVGKQALDRGVIQAYDMSTESVVTKFMWVLGQEDSYTQVRDMMQTNYTGEINKEGRIY